MGSYNEINSIKTETVSAVFAALSPILSINRCSINMFWRKEDSKIFRIGSAPESSECLVTADTDLCKGRKSLGRGGLWGNKEQQKHNLTRTQTGGAHWPQPAPAPEVPPGCRYHRDGPQHDLNGLQTRSWVMSKMSCFGPHLPARGQQLPQESWVPGRWACCPPFRQGVTFKNVPWPVWPVCPSQQITGPWSLLTLDIVWPCDKNEQDSWATAY